MGTKKTSATIAASSLLAFGFATPAQADVAPARLPNASMCVRADFTLLGSHWPVHEAVRIWNEAQDTVQLTTSLVEGCMVVKVSRYRDNSGTACAYTDTQGTITADGQHLATNITIGLNGYCLSGTAHEREAGWFKRRYIRSIVAHELGHAMGLDHNTKLYSIMNDAHGALRRIYGVDVRALARVYN